MTRKRRRLYIVVAGMLTLGVATALVLSAISDSLVFFYSPTDIAARKPPEGTRFRVGGLVQKESVRRDGDGTVRFGVTDLTSTVQVAYKGILPDLFREGQGVIAEGRLGADGTFRAEEVLAKHDETYMPKEVADALKKSGQWKGAQ
jgi:cytochrome c-type biogenesis protein CcmE